MNKTTIKSIAIIVVFAFILGGCSVFPKDKPQVTKQPDSSKLPQSITEQLATQTKIKKFENPLALSSKHSGAG